MSTEAGFLLNNFDVLFLYFLVFSNPIEHINPKNVIKLLKTEYSGYEFEDSPINQMERNFAKKFLNEMRNREKYFVTALCLDVFLDVLRFGTRRRLIKLERVGRRFHFCAETFFTMKPFLRVTLKLVPRVFG